MHHRGGRIGGLLLGQRTDGLAAVKRPLSTRVGSELRLFHAGTACHATALSSGKQAAWHRIHAQGGRPFACGTEITLGPVSPRYLAVGHLETFSALPRRASPARGRQSICAGPAVSRPAPHGMEQGGNGLHAGSRREIRRARLSPVCGTPLWSARRLTALCV